MNRINGRAIEDYKRFEVRETGLAVPKAEPLYIPAISNGYAPHDFIVDSSLVLYLPLYLLKGSKFKSVDRYQHTCTVTGALWRPNSRWFDGDNDVIGCGTASILDMTTNDFTIEAWINTDTADKMVVTKYGVPGWELFISGAGNLRLFLYQTGTKKRNVEGSTYIIASKWHHIVGTNDFDGYARVFVDGTEEGTPDNTAYDTFTSAQPVRIGARSAGDNFAEYIGEVRIYRRLLSATEIAFNRNATIWRYQ